MKDLPSGPGDFVTEAYNAKTQAELKAFYRTWAEDYDRQMLDELGYASPKLIASLLTSHFNEQTAEILDIGCGTGLCARYLTEAGYSNLSGIDLSAEMVEVARSRDYYQNLFVGDLNRPLEIDDKRFSAAICAGTFTHGHVGSGCLDEVFRVLKPGGLLACTIHFELWQSAGFEEKLSGLSDSGKILEKYRQADKYYIDGEPEGWFCLFEKR